MPILIILAKILFWIIIGLVSLFALGFVLTLGDHSVPKTAAQDKSLPHITINGFTYHAETYGDPANPVVITIHGGPGSDYRSILPLQTLADEYFVVFFDQRGAGLSPRVDLTEITLDTAIADLDSIIDHFWNGKKVNLVGHSWGAMLASAYIGQYPDKVDHAVLAEPGFLTSEFAIKFTEHTQQKMSWGYFYHILKTKFESLHVKGPDDHAVGDYFANQMSLYQGPDHNLAGYRRDGAPPSGGGIWRYGAAGAAYLQQQAVDEYGNFNISFIEGIENFKNKVLFIASECNTIIGVDWQREQMKLIPNAELAVIPGVGHEMFMEAPEASIAVVRDYLNTPVE